MNTLPDNEELVVLIVKVEDAKKVNWIYANKIQGKDYDNITNAIEEITG